VSVLVETRNRGHTLKMFEVLSRHYSEIKTPIDYLGESKYQEETATINTANIEKFRESETGKLYFDKGIANEGSAQ
jgi:hypothetical protein